MAAITDTELLDWFDKAYELQLRHDKNVPLDQPVVLQLSFDFLGVRAQGPTLRQCLYQIYVQKAPEIVAIKLTGTH